MTSWLFIWEGCGRVRARVFSSRGNMPGDDSMEVVEKMERGRLEERRRLLEEEDPEGGRGEGGGEEKRGERVRGESG